MKLLSRIMAFFSVRGEPAEVAVSAAEVKQDKVFLHPVDDPEHIYCIRSDAVDIVISPRADISEDDLDIIPAKKPPKEVPVQQPAAVLPPPAPTPVPLPAPVKIPSPTALPVHSSELRPRMKPISHFMPKMKTFSITLYPDEYDALMENIRSNGYKKTEFLLACVDAAKKTSMQKTYNRYTARHKERRTADRIMARQAREQEYLERTAQTVSVQEESEL